MIGNAVGESSVGAGGEIDLAAPRIFLLQKLKQFSVVGEMRDVESDMFGDKCFEGGFAAKNLPGRRRRSKG